MNKIQGVLREAHIKIYMLLIIFLNYNILVSNNFILNTRAILTSSNMSQTISSGISIIFLILP